MEQSWESFDVWQDFASARCTTKHVRGTAGWRQSWGCGWIFWCAPGALNKHSFERSPLDVFFVAAEPPPRGLPSSAQHLPAFQETSRSQKYQIPMISLFYPLKLWCSWSLRLTAAVVRIMSSSAFIVGRSCTDSIEGLFCHSTSSTAQGGGGSFKNRKPIGEIGCCESGMAERIHWWTERCLRSPLFLSLSLTIYLPTNLSSMYVSIYLSIDLYLSLSFSSNYLSI